MHARDHNAMTSRFMRRRRALRSLLGKHEFIAKTYQRGFDQSRRLAERYRQELARMGAV